MGSEPFGLTQFGSGVCELTSRSHESDIFQKFFQLSAPNALGFGFSGSDLLQLP